MIEQRAADPTMAEAPGGDTGLMVRSIKVVGNGEDAEAINLYSVDTALMAEIRNTLKQAAQEVGGWSEKRELSASGEGELTQIIFTMPTKGSNPPIFPDQEAPR